LRDQLKQEQDQNVELLERAVNAEAERDEMRGKLDEAVKWIESIHDTIGKRVRPQEVAAPAFPPSVVEPHTVEPAPAHVDEPPMTGTDPYRW
jgi:hypothetical protein